MEKVGFEEWLNFLVAFLEERGAGCVEFKISVDGVEG